MDLPANLFKRALAEGRQQIGLWRPLPGAYAAEALARSGFDWLLFDTEHSPGDPLTVLAQLQAIAAYPVAAVVRPASNDNSTSWCRLKPRKRWTSSKRSRRWRASTRAFWRGRPKSSHGNFERLRIGGRAVSVSKPRNS